MEGNRRAISLPWQRHRAAPGTAIAIAALLASSSAAAQHDEGLDLARAAVHEAGLGATEDEVAAIYAVAIARSRGSMRVQMPRFFAGRTSRPWALWLRRDAREPWSWPESMRWDRYRDRWVALLAIADLVVAGELRHRCALDPEFWGGPGIDDDRAARLELVEVPCGETRNRFFVSRADFEAAANVNEIDPE